MIDPEGREAKLYMTQQSYAAVGQLGQILAQEASELLPEPSAGALEPVVRADPGHQPRHEDVGAAGRRRDSAAGARRLAPPVPVLRHLGPGGDEPRRTAGRAGRVSVPGRRASGLPKLTAVDEGSVEPSRSALTSFLAALPRPLSYPVAIDQSGRIADGYEVQGEPWFVLASPTGRILWYWEV